MRLKQRVVWVGVALVALGVGGAAWFQRLHADPKVSYVTVPADRGRISAKVTATGTLSALVTVQVGSQVSGRLQAVMVDFNAPVRKGQVLAKLDPQLFQAALEQAEAGYMAAQSTLTKNEVQAAAASRLLARNQLLAARHLIAPADLDTAQANADAAAAEVKVANASVRLAKASLHQAEVNLAYTTIHSPIDGVVIARNVDVGQTVAASLQAPTLFLLAQDMRKLQVDASVAEADVGKLSANTPAEFSVDAYPNDRFTGTVRQIRNAPQTSQNVVTYDTVIDVSNPDLKLKPGMTANVTFSYAERKNALRVGNAALRFRPNREIASAVPHPSGRGHAGFGHKRDDSNARMVWVLRGSVPVPVKVRTGLTDGSVTEVVSGDLKAGDPVITDFADANQGRSGNAAVAAPRLKGWM